MKIHIIGRPEFQFQLTKAQIKLLMERSAAHYDGVCRTASSGNRDIPFDERFIHGWWCCMDNQEYYIHRASWRQLDIVLKVLEFKHPGASTEEEALRTHLRDLFWNAMTVAQEQMKQWKTDFDIVEKGEQ